MTIIDRMLFVSFIRAYAICLTSTLSLYIIVDLFTNLDSFASRSDGFLAFIETIAIYYGYRTIEYFDRLAEAITLLASVFTMTWMQRSNEILPLLSAGVSIKRIMRPIFFGVCLMLSLAALNQELVIPEVSDVLMKDREDPNGERSVYIQSAYDHNGVQIEGRNGNRQDQSVAELYLTLPDTASSRMIHFSANNARYIAPSSEPLSGGWLLTDTTPREIDLTSKPEMVEMLDPGRFFIHTKSVDFEALTRHPKWYMYASTLKINSLLQQSDAPRQNMLAVIFHMRFTRPLVGFIMVVMGLSIILRDQSRNVYISAGMCLAMCATFYASILASRFMGSADYLPPAFAAWLPVILFGPFALASYDAIQS